MVVLITEEMRGEIKVSLRTRNEGVNVASLATCLGGGGHNKAAAFKTRGKIINSEGGLASIRL